MKKYEYLKIRLGTEAANISGVESKKSKKEQDYLNELGDAGWELVSQSNPTRDVTLYTFKREK